MHDAIFTALLVAAGLFGAPGEVQHQTDGSVYSLATLAGTYFFSNGFSGENLTVSAEGRFKLTYFMCTGEWHAYGRAHVVDGNVILRTSLVSRAFGPHAPKELIPVRWGARLYLIPKDEGRSFCDHVNIEGGKPGWPPDPCFVRSGDDKKSVDGLPSVPKEWESMLLRSPIDGKVVEVIGRSRARVDFGYESGAWKGMPLWVKCKGSPWAQTVAVHATNCVIETNHPATVFKIGDRVSSRRLRVSEPELAAAKLAISPQPEHR